MDSAISQQLHSVHRKHLKAIHDLSDSIRNIDSDIKKYIKDVWECKEFESFQTLNQTSLTAISQQKILILQLEKDSALIKNESEAASVASDLEAFRFQLKSNSENLRKAAQFARQTIAEEERKNLFQYNQTKSDRIRKMEKKSAAVKATTMTDDLLRIRRLIAEQVGQSEQSLQALVRSSATVTEVNEEFKSMGSAIFQSKNLLSKYSRREISDFIIIILSFVFFFASCLYVIWKRLF